MKKMIISGYKPNDLGYKLFFTNTALDEKVIPMAFARNISNRIKKVSDPMAIANIKEDYFTGPLHFGMPVERDDEKVFFDIDLKSAYHTFLLNYKRGNFNYKVGQQKRYYEGRRAFLFNEEGMRVYKIRFAVEVGDSHTSLIYRKWLLKTTKVKGLTITKNFISGIIHLVDIEDLVNRFLDDVQGYENHDVVIDSIVVASGDNAVYINDKNIAEALAIKYNKSHPLTRDIKLPLNSSTGYLSIADKVLYYTMVAQVKLEVFKLIDRLERWNRERPDLPISIVAANTDGLTVYAKPKAHHAIKRMITYDLNEYSEFKFIIKDEYNYDNAVMTANDIRRS